MITDERCENCKFWKRYSPGHVRGECRRFPPLPRSDQDGDSESDFSESADGYWCGEWKEKKVK